MKIVLAAALIVTATPALAVPFTVTGVQTDHDQIITLDSPLSSPLQAYVGRIDLTTSTGKTLYAWCIDLFHDVYVGGNQHLAYTTGPIVDDHHGAKLTVLQRQEISGLVHQEDALFASGHATSTDSAATQLAIWSIEYPTFTYSGAADATRAEANQLIAHAPRVTGGEGSLIALGGTQSFASAVDAPASAAMLVAGMPLLWAARRRRRLS